MPFLDSLDIANRTCQLLGVNAILSVTEDTPNNNEIAAAYDKLRRAELRRNTWRFAIKKAALRAISTTTLTIVPSTYNSTATYMLGEIVADGNGLMWMSTVADNTNNAPGGNNEYWDAYFGPLTADLWNSGTTYSAGELVYVNTGVTPNGYQLYLSLTNANSDTPGTATAYDSTAQYDQDDVVSYSGSQWRSLLPVNQGNTPAVGPAVWSSGASYVLNDTVTGSDNYRYQALGSTTGNDPVTDGGVHWTNLGTLTAWTNTPTLKASSINWRPISATLKNVFNIYPVGSGPSDQITTRNVYRLPAGFLRLANQDPSAGGPGALGAPTNSYPNDWEFDGDFIVTAEANNIVFRFVADITVVRNMDDMFCEGLACRIAAATCVRLTQSDAKLASIASQYKLFMGEARLVNAIEQGPINPPEDDFIVVRA